MLTCVEAVPRGRVTTYGAIAEVVGAVAGGGGPRLVGSVMAAYGGPVPWWRVVRADGSLPPSHEDGARQQLSRGGHAAASVGQRRPQAGVLASARARASSARRASAAGKISAGGVTRPAPT